jgi:uncharacterized SAM-binding protein YcdF (DUF218 family)
MCRHRYPGPVLGTGRWRRPGRGNSRRWLRRVLVGCLLLLLVWLIGGYFVIVHPVTDRPTRVDAILVLGPPDVDGRVIEALALAQQHDATNLVISVTSDAQYHAKHACTEGITGLHVTCFQPHPRTTQGEAEEIGRLARAHGWTKIIVVTSTYHVSRARVIVDRCMPGQVFMVAAPGHPSLGQWAYQYLYQTGAFVKAMLNRHC